MKLYKVIRESHAPRILSYRADAIAYAYASVGSYLTDWYRPLDTALSQIATDCADYRSAMVDRAIAASFTTIDDTIASALLYARSPDVALALDEVRA